MEHPGYWLSHIELDFLDFVVARDCNGFGTRNLDVYGMAKVLFQMSFKRFGQNT